MVGYSCQLVWMMIEEEAQKIAESGVCVCVRARARYYNPKSIMILTETFCRRCFVPPSQCCSIELFMNAPRSDSEPLFSLCVCIQWVSKSSKVRQFVVIFDVNTFSCESSVSLTCSILIRLLANTQCNRLITCWFISILKFWSRTSFIHLCCVIEIILNIISVCNS